ncbi:hypothetical protein [Pyxidicoccus trucidator]|uniref:hypothetical protein n=1 Tax=Pyxidicoccus trucidator TaxID=2709662 RepID=UPI0013D97993|nr:hypothetical protein [Pyxidicoccus trucidator]
MLLRGFPRVTYLAQCFGNSEEVAAALREAESLPLVPPESLLAGVYARLPWHLAGQRSKPRAIQEGRAAVPGDD